MNMAVSEDHCVVLNSVASFRGIDSGDLNSEVCRDLLSQFTNNCSYYPRNARVNEENED